MTRYLNEPNLDWKALRKEILTELQLCLDLNLSFEDVQAIILESVGEKLEGDSKQESVQMIFNLLSSELIFLPCLDDKSNLVLKGVGSTIKARLQSILLHESKPMIFEDIHEAYRQNFCESSSERQLFSCLKRHPQIFQQLDCDVWTLFAQKEEPLLSAALNKTKDLPVDIEDSLKIEPESPLVHSGSSPSTSNSTIRSKGLIHRARRAFELLVQDLFKPM